MTKTLIWHALYDTTENLSNILKNRNINNTNNTNISNKFYTKNNYVRFYNSYTMKSEPYELPEWYNTERDDDIVSEFINEYTLLYDPKKTIKMEMDEYEEYSKLMEDISTIDEQSDEESENEWVTVS